MKSILPLPKALVAFLCLCLIGFAAFGAVMAYQSYRVSTADNVPNVTIPGHIMPHPNAFDFDVKATERVKDGDTIDHLASEISPGMAFHRPFTPHEQVQIARILADNKATLDLVGTGSRYPYEAPAVRSINTKLPYLAQFRRIARIMDLRAVSLNQNGQYSEAMNSAMDCDALGSQMLHGSASLGRLVGIACTTMGQRAAWRIIPRLNSQESTAAGRRLETMIDSRVPFLDMAIEENMSIEACLLEMMRTPNWRTVFPAKYLGEPIPSLNGAPPWMLVGLYGTDSEVWGRYQNYSIKWLAAASAPYSPKASWPEASPGLVSIVFDPSPLNVVELRDLRCSVDMRLLSIVCALHAYKLDHGAYPPSLQALVPAYIKEVFADPFTSGQPLRYRLQGGSYTLYSVGPDGTDDGGRPIFNPAAKISSYGYDKPHEVDPDSKGDIVAGVNIL